MEQIDLLERDAPRELLTQTFKQVRDREGAVVLVGGEAGVGKTSLITNFVEAQRPRARVLWGACDPLFTPRPLGPVYDIAVHDVPQLLDQLNSGAGWFSIAAALHKTLLESPLPTILVFEDVHWADEATLDLIKFLGRRAQQAKILFILTYREDEIGARHPLRAALGDLPAQRTLRIQLKPLSERAVEYMAHKMDRSANGIYAITRGNPFFVTEVLRSQGGIPATVRDAVLAKTAHLESAARELLEFASIIPGEIERWLLDLTLAPESSVVDACIDSGFLHSSGQGLVFRHELVRVAIEKSLPASRLVDYHRQVVNTLCQILSPEIALARLVHHAEHANETKMVLKYGPLAAEEASRHGAHREAVRYYQTTLRYRSLLPVEDLARLLDNLAFEYYLTGQIDPATQMRQEAATLWRQTGRMDRVGDDLRWLSRLSWFQGNKEIADRYAAEAIAALEPLPPGKNLAMAYSNCSQLHMLSEERDAAIAWGKKALELAETLHETEIIVHALTNMGTMEMLNGDDSGRQKLEQALTLALAHEMHDHVGRCYANLTSRLIENRLYEPGEVYLISGLGYTGDRDIDSYHFYLSGWQTRLFFEKGYWTEAEKRIEELLSRKPGSVVFALPVVTTLGHLKARQGSEDALRWLDQAADLAFSTGEIQRVGPLVAARAEAAWWNGRPEAVLEELRPAMAFAENTKGPYIRGMIAYWTWRAGGNVALDDDIPAAYRAMITGDWRRAADEWERIGCPFERALALSEGDTAAQLEALSIYERLGARPAARMLREGMIERGVKGLPRRARSSTRANPEGLTAREMDILNLLNQGLSNAEIAARLSISTKTVDHHVSAVLSKLQVRSRAEAAALARKKNIL